MLSRLKKTSTWSGGTLVVLGLLASVALPPVVRGQLETKLGEALPRPVRVAEVSINPLSPSLTVRGLQVKERSGDVEFVAFDELYVNLAWSSLLKLRQG